MVKKRSSFAQQLPILLWLPVYTMHYLALSGSRMSNQTHLFNLDDRQKSFPIFISHSHWLMLSLYLLTSFVGELCRCLRSMFAEIYPRSLFALVQPRG